MTRFRYIFILTITIGLAIFLSSATVKVRSPLVKVWVLDKIEFNGVTYVHKKSFDKNKDGIEFKANGVVRIKQNTSWCGTPPIDFETVRGQWRQMNDSIIHLEHPYWGGSMSKDIQITKLTTDHLTIRELDRE